jgi:hypothetical protein
MASSAAQRVARFRQRQRDEEILLRISVPEMPLIETLIEAGLLPQQLDHDNDQVARAVERLIEIFVKDKPQ